MKKTFGWITEWINVPCCGGTLSWKSEEISWNNCFLLFFILYFNTRRIQLSVTKKGTLCGMQKGLCRHECSKSSCLCKCSWRRKWVTRGQVVAVSNNKNSTQRFCDILHQSLLPDYAKSFAFSASLDVLYLEVSVLKCTQLAIHVRFLVLLPVSGKEEHRAKQRFKQATGKSRPYLTRENFNKLLGHRMWFIKFILPLMPSCV